MNVQAEPKTDPVTYIAPGTYLERVRSKSCYSVLRGMIFLFFLLIYAIHGVFGVAVFTTISDTWTEAWTPANVPGHLTIVVGLLFSLLLTIAAHQACRIAIDIADLLIHSGARDAGRQ